MSITANIDRWITYRRHSITKYRVHSPFLFSLITEVIEKRADKGWREAERVRKKWSKRKDCILRKDLGASENKSTKPMSIGYIVRHHAIKKRYGRLLYRLVQGQGAKKILELGTSVGISTSYIASAASDSEVYSVEACPETQTITKTHPLLQAQNIHLICAPFDEALDQFHKDQLVFDFVFIDGDHSKASTLRYFEKLLELSHLNTVFIFDDIHWSEGMEEAWAEIKARQEVTLTLDLFQFGVVYLKKELSKQDIILRFS